MTLTMPLIVLYASLFLAIVFLICIKEMEVRRLSEANKALEEERAHIARQLMELRVYLSRMERLP